MKIGYVVKTDCVVTDEPLDFKAILTCGQTFRFWEENGGYVVFSGAKKCFCKGNVISSDDPEYFVGYFDLDTDYDEYIRRLSGFSELKKALETGRGIRILHQDLFETIMSFIISANNNIPRIKGIIERICDYAGAKRNGYSEFPTPHAFASLSERELRSLGAGYRDKLLQGAAKLLYETDILVRLPRADTDEARKLLLTIPGVGPKVADCILLFGLRRWNCFPVDTWIMKQCGTKELDTPQKVRSYYLGRYGALAGLAQQYIFYGAREK